jgi:acetyl esterase/lipase
MGFGFRMNAVRRWVGHPLLCLSGLTIAMAAPAVAQTDTMAPIAIPAQPGAIELDTGKLPGATAPEAWHSQYGSVFARNVTVATLTPFLPDPAKATGTAVIVAPGGGFRTLSMENEGWDVARALAAQGVAAFVLKYRLNQTPQDMATFARPAPQGAQPPPRPNAAAMMAGLAPQIADARAAFATVRKRAGEWHVDPSRIGMIGFSAGAMLTMATTVAGKEAKPAFIGNIYGPLRRPADVRRAGRGRSVLRQWRLWVDRQLARGQAAGRVPFVRTGRSRLRHVPEDDHQHRLVR